jgi:hypothetical protein
MVLINIIQSALALVQALLGHFVTVTGAGPTLGPDYEWALGAQSVTVEAKGRYLMGAVADIAVYGAVMVDWVVQALLGSSSFNAMSAP